jgi:hypothetical protein
MKAALKEAQIPVALRSTGVPNICKTFWAFTQGTYFVIVQQYCERATSRLANSFLPVFNSVLVLH